MTALGALVASGCSSTVDIGVEIVNPCNQDAVATVDYLKFEPRGEGIDTFGLTTIVDATSGSAPSINIPLASDFQLVVTGHRGDPDSAPVAIGVSAVRDLTGAQGQISIRVPFALVDTFYKTTDLEAVDSEDPAGRCSALQVSRYGATATFLPDNRRVLIVGGANLKDQTLVYTRAVELYDPVTGRFDLVNELRSGGARAFHTATLLADGRVLIAGGEALVSLARESLKSALIIDARDPADVTITETGIMRQARTGHVAARLSDGRVVLAGGKIINNASAAPEAQTYLSSIEIFDPELGAFTNPTNEASQAVELGAARYAHSGTLLKTGFDILIAGGMNQTGPVLGLEVIHVDGGAVSIKGSSATLGVGPMFHAADLAQNGAVLLSGGYGTVADASSDNPINPSSSVEMWEYRDATGEIVQQCQASMMQARGKHTVSMFGRRAVFIGGRDAVGAPIASTEVATLTLGSSCFAAAPQGQMMTDPRSEHAVTELESSGELLVVGGRQQDGSPFGKSIDGAEVFSPAREP